MSRFSYPVSLSCYPPLGDHRAVEISLVIERDLLEIELLTVLVTVKEIDRVRCELEVVPGPLGHIGQPNPVAGVAGEGQQITGGELVGLPFGRTTRGGELHHAWRTVREYHDVSLGSPAGHAQQRGAPRGPRPR